MQSSLSAGFICKRFSTQASANEPQPAEIAYLTWCGREIITIISELTNHFQNLQIDGGNTNCYDFVMQFAVR